MSREEAMPATEPSHTPEELAILGAEAFDRGATGKELRPLVGHKGKLSALAFSADGRTLASSAQDKTLRLWDVATGKELRQFPRTVVFSMIFSPDGKHLLSSENPWRLLDLTTGEELARFPGACVFSPDGRSVVFMKGGSHKSSICTWSLETRLERIRFDCRIDLQIAEVAGGSFSNFALSADGRTLAASRVGAGGGSFAVYLWEMATGKVRFHLSAKIKRPWGLPLLAFSPDNRRLALSDINDVCVWDLTTGKELGRMSGHRGYLWSLGFTADGKRLISTSWQDTTLLVWDLAALSRRSADLEPPAGQR
jgi:WD40 repeat protein